MANSQTTLQECLDWLNGQIAFKPDHPHWEIIMSIIDRLEAMKPLPEITFEEALIAKLAMDLACQKKQ